MAQTERNMAETTQDSGSEAVPPVGKGPIGPGGVESQSPVQSPDEGNSQKPWHISSEYDPKRAKEYVVKEEGNYNIFIDPVTGNEVARVLKVEGRADGDEDLVDLKPPEDLTSPEWGRQLVDEIVRLRITMSYEERYNPENGPYLKRLYDYLQEHVNELCKGRNDRDPWDPEKAYKAIQEAQKDNQAVVEPGPGGGPPGPPEAQDQQPASQEQTAAQTGQPENLSGLLPIAQLTALYENIDTPVDQLPEIQRQLQIYFREAKRLGLLEGVDSFLGSLRDEIQGGIPANEVRRTMEQGFDQAIRVAEIAFRSRRTNPEVARLNGVWNAYISWARERFVLALTGQDQPGYREGEFRLNRGPTEPIEGRRETYWEPSSWSGYYIVSARTPEQFRIAAETFLHLIRRGSIGKSPEDVFKHLQNFKEAFGAAGSKQVESQRGREMPEGEKLTDEFMSELRLEFEALSYVFLADYSNESYNPKTYNQAMTTMALHEGPERWVRLIRAGEGQVGAFTHIFDKESIMEIFNNPVGERGELDIIAQHYLQDQIKEKAIERGMGIRLKNYDPSDVDPVSPAKFNPSEEADQVRTKCLKANLERIGLHMPDEVFKELYEEFDTGDVHRKNHDKYDGKDQNQLPDYLKKSIELGRIQKKVDGLDRKTINKLKEGKEKIDELTEDEQKRWREAYDNASANFDIAFQMQGATGEKVRRGRGFLYVDRNPYIQAYQAIELRSSRIEWLLGQFQKHKDTGGQESKRLEDFGEEVQSFWKALTPADKTRTPQGLYGLDSKKFLPEQLKSIVIGWMLSEIKEGRRLDTFTPQEVTLYNGLSEQDRSIYVDHVPTYLAEKFVQCAVTLTKIQHANSKAKDRSDAVDKARTDAIKELKANGFQAKLKNADGTVMKLKRPKLNPDGSKAVEDVEVSFQIATDPDNIYNRYTTHTYWGYQGENRHMLLAPHIFKAAERIRNGESRPEDEDMLAGMLLITDPTLTRVREFERDGIEKEITLLQAAVNESFLDHVSINKNLFKAFLPKDGNRGKMRAGYNMEDWGGQMRFAMGIKEFVASQPARLARRLGAECASIPIYVDAMGSLWGREGVGEACSTMADQIKRYSHQGVVGQFGITKFVDMQHYAQVDLYNALVGSVQESQGGLRLHTEGLLMKPTNDNEKLHRFIEEKGKVEINPKNQIEFLQELRSVFGRLETVLKVMRVMYSDVRNAGGALDLRKVDIFLENGKFNPVINEDSVIKMNTGTSRQLESDFYDEFAEWLISEWPGCGGDIYPEELVWNRFIDKDRIIWSGIGNQPTTSRRTFKQWFFEKAGL